jgi:hypothetical protein
MQFGRVLAFGYSFLFLILLTGCLESGEDSQPIVAVTGDSNTVVSSATHSVPSGGTATVNVTALAGYSVSLTVAGTCPAGSWSGSNYTTGAITDNCTVRFSTTAVAVIPPVIPPVVVPPVVIAPVIPLVPPTLVSVNPTSGAASGGVGVTLMGTLLTGVTSVTFGGVAATSVNILSSTSLTAVAPAGAVGALDVVVTTSDGSATLVNGYTNVTTAVGMPAFGGVVACLNSGNNLIAMPADSSTGLAWGGSGVGTGATSNTNGSSNTALIVSALGGNAGVPYAAQVCSTVEVDSQGNSPCQAGNTCYNDWFLPAGNNATASGQSNCLYTNRVAVGGFNTGFPFSLYWTSTESDAGGARMFDFGGGGDSNNGKGYSGGRARCVRQFVP